MTVAPAKADSDDTTLVRAVQEGEIECFEPLVDRHLGAVRAFLSLKAPVPQLVNELAHDTFVFAYQHLGKFEAGTSFRQWLRAIAWNLLRAEVLRFSRREARGEKFEAWWRTEVELSAPEATPDAEYLEECLEALPKEARTLVELHYTDGLDSPKIAERLARSRAWVRTTLFRIRLQLKTCINGKRAGVPRSQHA